MYMAVSMDITNILLEKGDSSARSVHKIVGNAQTVKTVETVMQVTGEISAMCNVMQTVKTNRVTLTTVIVVKVVRTVTMEILAHMTAWPDVKLVTVESRVLLVL